LVAAQERGFFEKYGLHVALQREVSWANIRDRVAFGELDAAHMYAADEPERLLPDFNVFARYAANFPWHSHGRYFLAQMQASGQLPQPVADVETVLAKVFRTDIYRLAADTLSLPYPTSNEAIHLKRDKVKRRPCT
jgi:hypothetical protein